MAVSPYVTAIRERIGSDLLLVPTVAVLPRDEHGRILLVRQLDSGRWTTVGGLIEPDESPQAAARREAEEEASVSVRLDRLLTAVGGPEYRITYPNGDRAACVAVVFEATVLAGRAAPDGEETCEVGWFAAEEIPALDLNDLNRHLLDAALPLLT